MRVSCALVSLLGLCGALPGQVWRAKIFEVAAPLGALEARVGAVPGAVLPVDRLEHLLTLVLKRENGAAGQVAPKAAVLNTRRRQQMLIEGDKAMLDLVQSVLDEMRREPPPRFHLTCSVLVMPLEIAMAHGLTTNDVQEADVAAMTELVRDVVKQKGTLLNLPETIATPFVPFVAEPRISGAGKQLPNDTENLRLRGEALVVNREEALLGVQLVRGSLPEDRTVLPTAPLFDRAFRLRVGNGVTVTAKNDKTATVLWLHFASTSTVEPESARPDNTDKKDENGKR